MEVKCIQGRLGKRGNKVKVITLSTLLFNSDITGLSAVYCRYLSVTGHRCVAETYTETHSSRPSTQSACILGGAYLMENIRTCTLLMCVNQQQMEQNKNRDDEPRGDVNVSAIRGRRRDFTNRRIMT
ncbi:hypothetical protein J6590_101841 [Homalodisca vitripennis]|nr:hypothetical protein J6590_101841 [Homalodisca vitripennis]